MLVGSARTLIFMRFTALHWRSVFIFHAPKVRLIEKKHLHLLLGQGERNLVSPAGSVGASAPLDTLRAQYSKRFVQTKSEIVRFAHGEIICSANCDICRFASSEMK